jgi:hypothetical protein
LKVFAAVGPSATLELTPRPGLTQHPRSAAEDVLQRSFDQPEARFHGEADHQVNTVKVAVGEDRRY